MFETLDTILSFVAIIFILSVIAQSIQSIIKRLLNSKTKQAVDGIFNILGLPENLKSTSIVQNIRKNYKIPELTTDNVKLLAEQLTGLETVKKAIPDITNKVDAEISTLKGKYTAQMQTISVIIAFLVALILNADSLQIIEKINSDKTIRQMLIQSDYIRVNLLEGKKPSSGKEEPAEPNEETIIKENLDTIAKLAGQYQGLNIGIKWSVTMMDFTSLNGNTDRVLFVGKKTVGILITTLLVSMGAPFWYDILDFLLGLKNKFKKDGK